MRHLTVSFVLAILFAAPAVAEAQMWRVEGEVEVVAREVEFRNGGVTLSGTLHVRSDAHDAPAVVVTHGSGTPERDSWLYEHLIEALPPVGLAVFVYDRRGTGASEGMVEEASFQDLADDALAAAAAIGRDPAVDRDRVGIWGQSQGGWLAMEAAARGDLAFVINVAGPMVTPAEQMYFVVRNATLLGDHDEEEVEAAVATRRAVDEWVRGDMERTHLEPILQEAAEAPWFERAMVPLADELPDDPRSRPWARDMDYDPVAALDRIEAKGTPTLVVYAGADPVIPVAESLDVLDAFQERGAGWLDVRIIPEADHILMFPESDDFMDLDGIDLETLGPESIEYFVTMGLWLERQLGLSEAW